MLIKIMITIVFMIPLYAFFIWSYLYPEESIMFGKRWMYREEPEFSQNIIHYTKFASLSAMFGTPIVLTSLLLYPSFFGLVLIAFLFVFLIGAFFILTGEN